MKSNLLILVVLLFSCSKSNNPKVVCIPEEKGIAIPFYDLGGSGYVFKSIATSNASSPSVNPNNSNEFAYVSESNGDKVLCVYNAINKTNKILYTFNGQFIDGFINRISWSKKNWILFIDGYYRLFKIKSNGENLTYLWKYNCHNPDWNKSGTLMCADFLHFDPITRQTYFLKIIMNEDGESVDTLNWIDPQLEAYFECWNNDRYIFGKYYNGFFVMDILNKSVKLFFTSLTADHPKWINDEELIFSNNVDGLIKYNVVTNEITRLRWTVNCNSYSYPTLIENNKILCQRTYSELLDSINGIVGYKNTICTINLCDTFVTDFDLN